MSLVLAVVVATSLGSVCHGDDFIVEMADGPQVACDLKSLNGTALIVEVEGNERQVDLAAVASIRPAANVEKPVNAEKIVGLIDGSQIPFQSLLRPDRSYELTRVDGKKAELLPKDIDWVRFQPLTSQADQDAWDALIADRPESGDALVIKRDSALDWLEGVVSGIDAESVQFRYEDRDVSVKQSRIVGFLLYHASGRKLEDSMGRVDGRDGSRLMIRAMTIREGQIELVSVCGATVQWRLDQVAAIDFSSGKTRFLTEFKPTFVDWQPLMASAAELQYLKKLSLPRFDRGFGNRPLSLLVDDPEGNKYRQTREFKRGIAIRGGSKLVYNVAGQYQTLQSMVGFPPNTNSNGNVLLRISGDGKALWEKVLTNRTPVLESIEIDIQNVERLTIETEYADGRAIGDVLHLCDIKVSK